jgi:hypothetical protein
MLRCQSQELADRYAAYAWGLDDYNVPRFRFTRNFFECSVLHEYLIEYPLKTHSSGAAYSRHDTLGVRPPPEIAPHGEWEVHRGLGLVIEELVRQVDMRRHVLQDGGVIVHAGNVLQSKAKKGEGASRKCLLM